MTRSGTRRPVASQAHTTREEDHDDLAHSLDSEARAFGPSLRTLRWVSVWVPTGAVILMDFIVRGLLEGRLGEGQARLVGIATVLVTGTAFTIALFMVLGRMQETLAERNRELAVLNAVGTALGGPHDVESAFNGALDALARATGAQAATLSIHESRRGALPVIVSWVAPDDGPPPEATGLRGSGLSRAGVPLRVHGGELGTLTLEAPAGQTLWLGASDGFLDAVGRHFASAVHTANLFRDVTDRNEVTLALHQAGVVIHNLTRVQDVLNYVGVAVRERFHSTEAFAYLGDHDTPDASSEHDAGLTLNLAAETGWAGHVSAPLQIGGRTLGRICVCDAPPAVGTDHGMELLEGLADLASAAINGCWLRDSERRVAVLEERESISREMHDSIAQALGYLHLQALATRDTISRDPDAARRSLADMGEVAKEAYVDVREGIQDLREKLQQPGGLLGALAACADKFSRHSGVRADVETAGAEPPNVGPDVEIQLVRVVQEALTNARKHAHASAVAIRVGRLGDCLAVTISDDGCGFDATSHPAGERQFGLRTMRERVERVGGKLTIDSHVGSGTTIQAVLPAVARGSHDYSRSAR